MARDYIAHGVRARAQSLITLELGPETEVERVQKLFNEVGQERLTRLDRSLVARAKDGIRQQDTFSLAPWRPGLEPFKGRAVTGMIGPTRVTWSLDRGRALPGRG
jgi:hypothetical protein